MVGAGSAVACRATESSSSSSTAATSSSPCGVLYSCVCALAGERRDFYEMNQITYVPMMFHPSVTSHALLGLKGDYWFYRGMYDTYVALSFLPSFLPSLVPCFLSPLISSRCERPIADQRAFTAVVLLWLWLGSCMWLVRRLRVRYNIHTGLETTSRKLLPTPSTPTHHKTCSALCPVTTDYKY